MKTSSLSLLNPHTPLSFANLKIFQPTLSDIDRIGEYVYNEYLSSLILSYIDVADILWIEQKIWYEDISSDWDFFIQSSMNTSDSIKITLDEGESFINGVPMYKVHIDALNFFLGTQGLYIYVDKNTPEGLVTFLYNVYKNDENDDYYILNNNNFYIDCQRHFELVEYLKQINWHQGKEINKLLLKKGGTKRAKKMILNQNYRDRKNTNIKPSITLASIVSSLIAKNQPYDKVWDYPIYLIYELYHRYSKFVEWDNTMNALYNGCLDTKKINWDKINWSSVINNK